MIKKPILIAYATRAGSTKEVAESIGESLVEHGARIDVLPVEAITTLEPYSAVILGSAIRAGHWLPEAVEFVQQNKADLEQLPLVYFLVCATMREDTPQHHDEVLAYLKPVRAILEPLDIGLFAGKLDINKLGFFAKLVVKAMRKEQGDWRDWEAVHDWAGKIFARLEHNDIAPAANAIVTTQQGKVQGSLSGSVYAFKGIPYAAPPFGANRLQAPRPAAHWSGVTQALTYGPKCPQLPYPPPWDVLLPELVDTGEDCLTLNVWSSDLGSAKQPVMVWIPGGAFENGTAAMAAYDGSKFARDGIVCVTINYRLGAEGFLYLGDGIANLGLLDQIAALEWVQQNIAAFGGDPGNVTIFGESAGGMSVGMLLCMPRAKGLFRRAIAQSGAAHQVITAETALRVGRRLAERLGVAATREAFAAVPVERLLQAQAMLKTELATHPDPEIWGREMVVSNMLWQPVIDDNVIPARPIDLVAAGASSDIDLMLGSTTGEWRFFLVPGNAIAQITPEILAAAIAGYGLPVDATLVAYRAAHPDAGAGDLLAAVQSDWYIRVPVLRLADAHANAASQAATYMYEFAWPSPMYSGQLGACHSLEVPFVFDTFCKATEPLLGSAPPQQLADFMHAAWVAFASTGTCSWPLYDSDTRAAMRFDTQSEVVEDSQSVIRALWEKSVDRGPTQ